MRLLTVLAATAVAAVALPPAASAASHTKATSVHRFTGTVSAVAKNRTTLRIARSGRAGVLFRLGKGTRGARQSSLKRGQHVVITARRAHGGWVAARIAIKKARARTVTPVPEQDDAGTDPIDDSDQAGDYEDTGGDYADDPGGEESDPGADPGADE